MPGARAAVEDYLPGSVLPSDELQQRYRVMFERSPVGQVELDAHGCVLLANAAFCHLVGVDEQMLRGRPLHAGIGGPELTEAVLVAATAGDPNPQEHQLVLPDGRRLATEISATGLAAQTGALSRVLCTVVDRTDRTLALRALRARNVELAAARDEARRRTELLDAVLDTVDVGIVACDGDGALTLVNRACRNFHLAKLDPPVRPVDWVAHYGLREEDGVTPLTTQRVPLWRALHDGEVTEQLMTIVGTDGLPRVLRCDGRALRSPDGTLTGAVVAMKDVTALRASEQRFREDFENGPTPLARLDTEGTVSEANPALRRFLGVASSDVLGRPLVALVHPDDHHRVAGLGAGNTDDAATEARVRRADGAWIWCELAGTRGAGPKGQPYSLVQLLDVDARKAQELRLQRAVQCDSLTGVGNRHLLTSVLDELLADDGPGAALLFVDLDDFKAVNDRYGHDAGDEVLIRTAHRLTAAVRPQDTVVRLGGDEFVVLAPSPARHPRQVAEALAVRVEAALSEDVTWEGRPLPVGASVGVSIAAAGTSPTDALVEADRAMYRRKAMRRGLTAELP